MFLQSELQHTLDRTPANLGQINELIEPVWISQALQATGTASIRRRKLPAEQVVWLVIGLALFRNQPIWHIVHQRLADGGCADMRSQCDGAKSAAARGRAAGATVQATDPGMRAHHTSPPCLRGLRTLAVDGVVWSAPDTPENRAELGCCANQHGEGRWPQIRVVRLMDTHRHELMDARVGAMTQGELTLAAKLRGIDQTLTVFDRAYFSAAFLQSWQNAGQDRHWLMRAKDNLRYEVIRTHASGDELIRVPI